MFAGHIKPASHRYETRNACPRWAHQRGRGVLIEPMTIGCSKAAKIEKAKRHCNFADGSISWSYGHQAPSCRMESPISE